MSMTIDDVVKKGLCIGCGTCVAACPTSAIRIERDIKRGLFVPKIEECLCIDCGKCVRVCPGLEVDFAKLSKAFLGVESSGDILGAYKSCYFGHASDNDIRYNSSSGGLVTALLIHSLEQGMIDAALVTWMSADNPLEPHTGIAETREQIIAACGSKYCPTSIGNSLREISERDGRFAVVGLPCQIQGLRKLEEIDSELHRKIVLHLGIFCVNNNTFLGTEYFLKAKGISPCQVSNFCYRGRGWPGKIRATLRDGKTKEFLRGPSLTERKDQQVYSSAFHYDFMIPRCFLCSDLASELADISFADPWNRQFLEKETVGKSMIVVRSEVGEDILFKAKNSRVVELIETDAMTVKQSQSIGFKMEVGSRIFVRKLFGMAAPIYKGKNLPVKLSGILTFGYFLMSFLTLHRWLWSILRGIHILRFTVIRGRILLFRCCSVASHMLKSTKHEV